MTENKQYITNNPHNKSYIFCDSVRLNNIEVAKTLNELATKCSKLEKENEQLKQQLLDIKGELVMLDNCDNWDYDRMKHTVREIAEIIGYNGTINPKR